jgi:hypothetical protein
VRVVLLGMNNTPVSDQRLHGCLQRRVPEATRADYFAAFERLNLMGQGEWGARKAREQARFFAQEYKGRRVIVLGSVVRDALGLTPTLISPVVLDGVTYRQLPHLSGRGRWYNDPVCVDLAAMVLEEAYAGWRSET